jgi:hypothetical protein
MSDNEFNFFRLHEGAKEKTDSNNDRLIN